MITVGDLFLCLNFRVYTDVNIIQMEMNHIFSLFIKNMRLNTPEYSKILIKVSNKMNKYENKWKNMNKND